MAMTRYQPPSTGLIHLWPLILFMVIIITPHQGGPPWQGASQAGGLQALACDLANAALRSAQTKATHAQSLIALLLQNATNSSDVRSLQICQSSNNEALSQLSSANNDFNTDSLDSMVELMNAAADVTKACLNEIQGRGHHFSLLAAVNADLIKLCEICIVSTRYFTIEDLY
ncbi:putative Tetratricopeptide repeat-like superfamily protein [Hibiscus syriacus]|uniref:Tetratricopeptide repeat-like superfamily protein n=1 Tax=Hibiscus syriacus TaxID=106335 RepID=A0A6A3CH64_HIBSY|nr:putative Tetratricopeptide repeat-like superfamily protein [Hibiscus syriacus]